MLRFNRVVSNNADTDPESELESYEKTYQEYHTTYQEYYTTNLEDNQFINKEDLLEIIKISKCYYDVKNLYVI